MKALEDLSTQYDLTVRNSVGVMIQVQNCIQPSLHHMSSLQFRYGDDGLDPTYMEGNGKPVALDRLYDHVLASQPAIHEHELLPEEVCHSERSLCDPSRVRI